VIAPGKIARSGAAATDLSHSHHSRRSLELARASAWRAVPDTPLPDAVAPPLPAYRVVPPVRPDPSRMQRVGLSERPNPVVVRVAVPDWRARRFPTSPSPPGAYATIRWSRPSNTHGTTGQFPRSHATCSYAGAGGKTSISQSAHRFDRSRTRPRRHRSAQSAARPRESRWRNPAGRATWGRASPSVQREAPSRIAPTPRTGAGRRTPRGSKCARRSTGPDESVGRAAG
jgi:hypothetical protein